MGMPPEAFWRQTPLMLHLVFKGRHKAAETDQRGRAWIAWHTAYLPNLKKRPDLREFLGLDTKKTPETKASGVAAIALTMRKWAVKMAFAQPPAGQKARKR